MKEDTVYGFSVKVREDGRVISSELYAWVVMQLERAGSFPAGKLKSSATGIK